MSAIEVDAKISLLAIGSLLVVAASNYFSLHGRVDNIDKQSAATAIVLDKQELSTQKLIEKQDGKYNTLLVTMIGVEKTLVAIGGRLEKIEYRLDGLEKRTVTPALAR